MACPQLVDVHREEAIQADHGWRHCRAHQVAEPALGPLACGPGSRHPGYRSVHGAGVHRYGFLREAGRRLGQGVRLLVTVEAAVGGYPLEVDPSIPRLCQTRESVPYSSVQLRALLRGPASERAEGRLGVRADDYW